MKCIMMNRRVVVVAIILSCLSILAVQSVVAEDAITAATPPLAQIIISQWRAIFPDQPYVCWAKTSPWKNLNKFQSPPAGVKELGKISLDMGKNEYESTSFVLTNLSKKSKKFKISSTPSTPKGISTTLRKGVWVIAQGGAGINDALSLIDDGKVVIPSGGSLEIWITLKSDNAAPGKYQQTINVSSKGLKSRKINIETEVHNVSLPKKMPLRTFYWDYLISGPIGPKNRSMVDAKFADLKSHYTTTTNLHPAVLPVFNFKNGKLATQDYTNFDKAIDEYEKGLAPQEYVFEMIAENFFEPSNRPGYSGAKNRPKFLSPEWKVGFSEWLRGMVAHLKSRGMGYDKYTLHPYDELLHGKMYELSKLIKETDPKVRVLANSLGRRKTIEKIGPYIDVWMPLFNSYLGIGGVDGGIRKNIPLKPNTKYTYSFYAKSGSCQLLWQLMCDGGMRNHAKYMDTPQWKKSGHTFTTGPKTTQVQIGFFPTVGNGNIFIDDLYLAEENGKNILVNGDMEQGDPPTGWTVVSAKISADTADPHSGKQAAEISVTPSKTNPRRDAVREQAFSKPSNALWIYANPQGVPATKANPYNYYRWLLWKAWDEKMTGFGYWIYCYREAWDYNRKGAPREGGYAVVYNATLKGTPPEVSKKELIVPGKRWEATREGIEDYTYLYLLKQAIGKASPEAAAKAKKLLASWTEKVLENPNNPQLADEAKKQIMKEIVKISAK